MAPGHRRDKSQRTRRPSGLGANVALARRLGLIDAQVERTLSALRKLRNAFAHSAESASLSDPGHSARLTEIYAEARANPIWSPLEAVLAAQPPSAQGPLEPALGDYILLISILVAFLEAMAQQITPYKPPIVMGFSGISQGEGVIGKTIGITEISASHLQDLQK